MKQKITILATIVVVLLCSACEKQERLEYQKYIFPYRTVVEHLQDECSQGVTDRLMYLINDKESEWLSRRADLTINEEKGWSERIHKEYLLQYIVKNEVQEKRIGVIVNKMIPYIKNKRFPIQYWVINMPVYNAFSTVGGRLYFTETLLKEVSDEELAFIIGHEIGHLENKHCVDKIKFRNNVGIIGAGLFNLIFSGSNQKSELESDYAAAYLTFKAGLNPEAGEALFLRWSTMEDAKTGVGKFFRSHPYSDDRASCLAAYIDRAEQDALDNPTRRVTMPLFGLLWQQYPTFIGGAIAAFLLLTVGIFYFIKKRKWLALLVGYPTLLLCLFLASKQSVNFCYGAAKASIHDKQHPQPVNIRCEPTVSEDNVSDKMPDGEEVTIYFAGPKDKIDGKEGRWCLISRGDISGWTWGDKLVLE